MVLTLVSKSEVLPSSLFEGGGQFFFEKVVTVDDKGCFLYSPQERHFIRHTALVIKSEKKNSRKPVIIAPITLVAANVMPRRIIDVKVVPRIAVRNVLRLPQQFSVPEQQNAEVRRLMPRNPTAMPRSTHKNAGVIVIRAVKRKIAARTPMIMLAIMDFPVQLIVQSQFDVVIVFTSTT